MSERARQLNREGGGNQPEAGPFTYDRRALTGDMIRAGFGLLVTGGPLVFIRPLPVVEIVMLLCAALFALYLARTVLRLRTVVEVGEDGIAERALSTKTLSWPAISSVKLRYYTTKRGRDGAGWLVLTLKGGENGGRATKIVVESTLNGFNAVLEAVAKTVAMRGLSIDETSVHNFAAAGVPIRLDTGDEAGTAGEVDR